MVKICPKCNMKNSNNSEYCINCSFSLAGAEIVEEKSIDSTIDTHYNFKVKENAAYGNVWRPFSILGIIFAIIAFFINILYIFSGLAIMLGGISLLRGDVLDAVAIILGSISAILCFVF